MCAQTRPQFILIQKRFWGMESEPMLTSREKSSLPEKFLSEENRTHDAASSRTASPATEPVNVAQSNHGQMK